MRIFPAPPEPSRRLEEESDVDVQGQEVPRPSLRFVRRRASSRLHLNPPDSDPHLPHLHPTLSRCGRRARPRSTKAFAPFGHLNQFLYNRFAPFGHLNQFLYNRFGFASFRHFRLYDGLWAASRAVPSRTPRTASLRCRLMRSSQLPMSSQ